MACDPRAAPIPAAAKTPASVPKLAKPVRTSPLAIRARLRQPVVLRRVQTAIGGQPIEVDTDSVDAFSALADRSVGFTTQMTYHVVRFVAHGSVSNN